MFTAQLEKGASILDFGCGSGQPISKRTEGFVKGWFFMKYHQYGEIAVRALQLLEICECAEDAWYNAAMEISGVYDTLKIPQKSVQKSLS